MGMRSDGVPYGDTGWPMQGMVAPEECGYPTLQPQPMMGYAPTAPQVPNVMIGQMRREDSMPTHVSSTSAESWHMQQADTLPPDSERSSLHAQDAHEQPHRPTGETRRAEAPAPKARLSASASRR